MLDDFLLGQHIEGAVGLHGLQLVQTVDTGTHGLEVGHHTAQPAGVDVVHAAAGSLILDGLLGLLLGAHEQQGLAALGQLTHEGISLLQLLHGLLQVDDIDAVALGVDIGSHLGVPATGLMTEMHTGLQQSLHGYDVLICHFCCFSFCFSLYLQPPPPSGQPCGTDRRSEAVRIHQNMIARLFPFCKEKFRFFTGIFVGLQYILDN